MRRPCSRARTAPCRSTRPRTPPALGIDEPHDQRFSRGRFPTKKVVAALRIATSSRSRAFSAFNRRISSRSALVIPSRSPASTWACTSQRRTLVETPSCLPTAPSGRRHRRIVLLMLGDQAHRPGPQLRIDLPRHNYILPTQGCGIKPGALQGDRNCMEITNRAYARTRRGARRNVAIERASTAWPELSIDVSLGHCDGCADSSDYNDGQPGGAQQSRGAVAEGCPGARSQLPEDKLHEPCGLLPLAGTLNLGHDSTGLTLCRRRGR